MSDDRNSTTKRNRLIRAISNWQLAEYGKPLSDGKIGRVLDALDAIQNETSHEPPNFQQPEEH